MIQSLVLLLLMGTFCFFSNISDIWTMIYALQIALNLDIYTIAFPKKAQAFMDKLKSIP